MEEDKDEKIEQPIEQTIEEKSIQVPLVVKKSISKQ